MNQRDRSEIGAASDTPGTNKHVHITFSFHCAVVKLPDKRRTDILLSPGMRHGMGHASNGAAASGAMMHQAEHIASLRIPEECIIKERSADHGSTQVTTRLDRPESADVTWRLEEHDVVLRIGSQLLAGSQLLKEPPANISLTNADRDVTYVVPDFAKLAGMKVDPACYSDGDEFPRALRKGARVRLTGGTLECGVPTGPLKHRRWKVGSADNVALSDRMEYRKDLDDSGDVALIFRKFDDPMTKTKTVYLTPNKDGIVRIHISNDPFAVDPPQGSKEIDPCAALRHFGSYSLLLYPAGEDKSSLMATPTPLPLEGDAPLLVSEGSNTACCPCGDTAP
jgi:hypothetical protein